MATIELNLDDRTLAHARRVAEWRKISLDALIADLIRPLPEPPAPGADPLNHPLIGLLAHDEEAFEAIMAVYNERNSPPGRPTVE